ncbi:hypothetical protein M422DRAFT_54490 [Sphaerobolus stellatus SS14]|uniref:Uncharacterized protein n=1 Tax=Sphaerobolus stellatus (strain SS14) TaxID=990650 RepID=A0A0C9TH05_SPHS4|nr:hypothetical protein M422DRAFT_54490 [Sphaerobolus stellatus SS14]
MSASTSTPVRSGSLPNSSEDASPTSINLDALSPASRAIASGQAMTRVSQALAGATTNPTTPRPFSATHTSSSTIAHEESTRIRNDALLPSSPLTQRQINVDQAVVAARGTKRLRDESEEKLKEYVGLRENQASNNRLFAELLRFQDAIFESGLMAQQKKYELPEDLKTEIKWHSWMVALAPELCGYLGSGPSTAVYDSMRAIGVANMPNERATADVTAVISAITKKMNNIRNAIKTILNSSLDEKNIGKRYVTSVAKQLAQKSRIVITTGLLERMAFLRTWLADLPADIDAEKFWTYADKKLKEYEKELTPIKYAEKMRGILNYDMQKYERQPEEEHIQNVVVSASQIPATQKICMEKAKAKVRTGHHA